MSTLKSRFSDPAAASGRAPSGRATTPEARRVRRRFTLLQMATTIFSWLAGAVVAMIVVLDANTTVVKALGAAPGWWLLGFAVVFALGSVLTLSLANRLMRQIEDVIQARRQEAAGLSPTASVAAMAAALDPALSDRLTGLGNHRSFHETVDRLLENVHAGMGPLALVTIDIDDFRSVNDTGGHATGDQLIAELSRLIRKVMRRSDLAFRVGGDEFAILMPGTRAEDGAMVVQRLLAACIEPRAGSAAPRGFSISAGVSDAPGRAATRNDLVGQAEQALLECKRSGRTSVRLFDPGQKRAMDEPSMRRASASIVEVVRASSLTPVYQPIVELATGRVVGFEGLVRPVKGSGFEDPSSLFAVAEATGRTADLDRLCLETLMVGAGDLAPDQSLSLNLSPHTLEAPEFSVALLVRMLSGRDIDPSRIVLELTERQAITDFDALRKHLSACQQAGFKVAIDDVGAGNAGLRLLSQLHFDKVKIDMSLVQAGARRESSLEVLRSIAELAERWGATAVAEGVETPSQLRMIRDLGLAEVQGYLLARPMPRADLRSVDLGPLWEEPNLRATLGFASVPASPLG